MRPKRRFFGDKLLKKNKKAVSLQFKKKKHNNYINVKRTTMTKADIVNEISKSTGIEKAVVLETVEKFMETVKDSLGKGENVYLRGFGNFIVKQRAQKTARNISKETTIIIPAHNIPAFKPAKVFMNEVK